MAVSSGILLSWCVLCGGFVKCFLNITLPLAFPLCMFSRSPYLAPGEALRAREHLSEGPTARTPDAVGRSDAKLLVQSAH